MVCGAFNREKSGFAILWSWHFQHLFQIRPLGLSDSKHGFWINWTVWSQGCTIMWTRFMVEIKELYHNFLDCNVLNSTLMNRNNFTLSFAPSVNSSTHMRLDKTWVTLCLSLRLMFELLKHYGYECVYAVIWIYKIYMFTYVDWLYTYTFTYTYMTWKLWSVDSSIFKGKSYLM